MFPEIKEGQCLTFDETRRTDVQKLYVMRHRNEYNETTEDYDIPGKISIHYDSLAEGPSCSRKIGDIDPDLFPDPENDGLYWNRDKYYTLFSLEQ